MLGQLGQDVAQAILLHRAYMEAPESIVELTREIGFGWTEAAGNERVEVDFVFNLPQFRPSERISRSKSRVGSRVIT